MSVVLIKTLIDKEIIVINSIITARFPAKSLGEVVHLTDEFVYEEMSEHNGIEFIKAFRPANQTYYSLLLNNIIRIDGMGLQRLAGIYGIKEDGTSKKEKIDPLTGLPIRRGRKPKRFKELSNVGINTA